MKIKLELFGASRDFSENDHLEIEVKDKASVEDLRICTYKVIKQIKEILIRFYHF